jgi:transposase
MRTGWALKVTLSENERSELRQLRRKHADYRGERALMVLLNADGETAPGIARKLNRNAHTVRTVLKRYMEQGVDGLRRRRSPGRPAVVANKVKPLLEKILRKTPQDYKLPQQCWTKELLIEVCEKEYKVEISKRSMVRVLHAAGYSWKRPQKTTPAHAPSKEEKKVMMEELINELGESLMEVDAEVFILDESHFSTEPYLFKGWFKKGERFFPQHAEKTGKLHRVWCVESEDARFLLEKQQKGKR